MRWTMGMLVPANEFIIYNYKTAGIAIGVLIFALMAISTTQKGKLILDRIWLNTPIFDTLARHMVGVGETSGSLDEVLDNIGTYFTDEVETRIQVLLSTMVSAITVLIGAVVAIINITVILTVLGAVNSVR